MCVFINEWFSWNHLRGHKAQEPFWGLVGVGTHQRQERNHSPTAGTLSGVHKIFFSHQHLRDAFTSQRYE